ncbi:MAG: hypothetical protein J0665_14230 [Deltaproteobacteria bacterium]|nr:hypothetical protein [Deltaproteobacteria bacterium]
MCRNIFALFMVISVALWSSVSSASPDQYPGDTSIYGGAVAATQANVLIIIDTSGSMSETVPGSSEPYNAATTYPSLRKCDGAYCSASKVYNASDNSLFLNSVDDVTTSCNSVNPRDLLKTTGQYSGRRLNNDGTCGTRRTRSYVLGNYVNWLNGPGKTTYKQKMIIAKDVVKNIVQSTSGVKFGLMRYNNSEGGRFVSATVSSSTFISTIKNMDDIFTGTTTNRAALVAAVDTLSADGWTPMGETLFEAMRYFKGGATAFSNTVGVTSGSYTSPIQASCQQNYVIFVTDGMATQDYNAVLKTICTNGDCDGDGKEPGNLLHSLDDVAKYLYDTDMSSSFDGKQNVTTFTIGFGDVGSDDEAVELLNRAADSNHGHGQAYLAGDQAELSTAITQIVSNIMEINTSFVAPVVPVSPENKTASASRVYIGLFKPINEAAWEGNLKKYGLDSKNYLTDKNGAYANYVDLNNDGFDDRVNPDLSWNKPSLPLGAVNGSFVLTSSSFWSSTVDAADVTSGGVGEKLLTRSTGRNIYTYMGSDTNLTGSSNTFSTANTGITSTLMEVADATEKNKVVSFIHGLDAYDDNSNGNTTEKREWIMGDVLHAKPMVVNYASYTFNTTNEADCSVNKSIIYAGSNDGMLHAFKDCDGSEAWSYLPAELLPSLQYVHAGNHTYFVDSSPFVYIYDKNKDGIINLTDDKVILLVGLRRGGGINSVPATGYYYALDVSDPATPKFMWEIDNSSASYPELAEAWSEPKIVKLKVGSTFKIAALIGGGYDNLNDDARFGATQTFLGTGAVSYAETGAGDVTSTGTSAAVSPMGRAIYAVEIADIPATGIPGFSNSGAKLWEYTWGNTNTSTTNTSMTFSVASEIAALDSRGRGYIDRLYTVDTGGNLWRFDVGTGSTSTWTGRKIFSPNPGVSGAADKGRKAFYKPSVTIESGYDMVFYGTGDREHPLNTPVVDRIYAIKVRDIDTSLTPVKTESNLVDVTLNQLQSTTITNIGTEASPTVGSEAYILKQLHDNEGWFIQLNESPGEKVLASPTLFNKVLYVTTFLPTGVAVVDPCQPANLGSSNSYALNYLTGEAVLDYSGNNDAAAGNNTTVTTNTRAKSGEIILQRADRKQAIGQGIASGVVVVVSNTGQANIVIGSSGNIVLGNATKGGVVRTLFWRQK